MPPADPLEIRLYGPLQVLAPDGADLTPKGARKVLGLLALLATAPGLTQRRTALQRMLWSERSPEQRSASLRQALSALKQALGPWGGALRSDRDQIALDVAQVRIAPAPDDGAVFLDGLTIPDPEFDAWLRLERGMRHQATASAAETLQAIPPETLGPATTAPALFILREPKSNALEALIGNLFADSLARSLSEQFTLEVTELTPRAVERQRPQDLLFSADALVSAGVTALRVSLEAGPRRRKLWAGHRFATDHTGVAALENDEIQRLVNEAVEGYADALLAERQTGRQRVNASVLGRIAVREIFTMRPEAMANADDLLNRAYYLDPRGIYLAWKVLLRVIRLVERHDIDAQATTEEALALARQAVEFEPMNSMVLAAASNAASLVEGNSATALEFAQRAVRLNQSNPLAWDCLSTAALHGGKLEEAYVYAVKSQRLAGNTPFKHWYDMGRVLMATVTGRIDEALQLAGAASVVPHFKPPLRYIAALYAHAGQHHQAHDAVARLRLVEPDFSTERLLTDPEYPVAALRRSQILRRGLFGEIG